jgi:glyoxalase-like protein
MTTDTNHVPSRSHPRARSESTSQSSAPARSDSSPATLALDHLAITAPDLQAGIDYVRHRLGVDIPAGGTHAYMGTHNHLMALGKNCYLEVICADPAAPEPAHARWFGLDTAPQNAGLAHWIVSTTNMAQTLRQAPAHCGPALAMSRAALNWLISVPADGSLPFDGACPSFIEWPAGPHPAAGMADLGCRLTQLLIEHPQAAQVTPALAGLEDPRLRIITGPVCRLRAEFDTPSGRRILE